MILYWLSLIRRYLEQKMSMWNDLVELVMFEMDMVLIAGGFMWKQVDMLSKFIKK